jgi:hypothetical protein
MEFGSFEEFWKALGRLYDSTVKNTEDIRELRASIEELSKGTQRILSAVERHQIAVEGHEHRLDKHEITIEAILEDLRRHREGRSPQ